MIGRLVILLLAANAAWFAWSQGWLRGVGMGPAQTREPERLERQVRPETLQVRPLQEDASGTAGTAGTAASAPSAASAYFASGQGSRFDQRPVLDRRLSAGRHS